MISTALFEETQRSERSDRAFFKQRRWLWGLYIDGTLQRRSVGVVVWLQL